MATVIWFTAVIVALANVKADVSVPGIQTTAYSIGSVGNGYFSSDASSIISSRGNIVVGYNSRVEASSTSITVEVGSKLSYVPFSPPELWGYSFSTGQYWNSLVTLSHASTNIHYPFTQYQQRGSTLRMDGSQFPIGRWSFVQLSASNVQLMNSDLIVGDSNRLGIANSQIAITTSHCHLGNSTQLDLQGATLTLTDSSMTTGKGTEVRMSVGSTLLANKLTVTTGEYSKFNIAPGASILTIGSPSSITLGNRAELNVTANCVALGEIQVPELTRRNINITGGYGFNCYSSLQALKLFISKTAN